MCTGLEFHMNKHLFSSWMVITFSVDLVIIKVSSRSWVQPHRNVPCQCKVSGSKRCQTNILRLLWVWERTAGDDIQTERLCIGEAWYVIVESCNTGWLRFIDLPADDGGLGCEVAGEEGDEAGWRGLLKINIQCEINCNSATRCMCVCACACVCVFVCVHARVRMCVLVHVVILF